MSYRFYNFSELPGRILFVEGEPSRCELFDPALGRLAPDNPNMLDMLTHHQSLERWLGLSEQRRAFG
jgi:hypothetical protein